MRSSNFEGKTHHAGECQDYLDYVAGCLASGVVPRPSAAEGIETVALLVAMDEACRTHAAVRVDEVMRRYGLET